MIAASRRLVLDCAVWSWPVVVVVVVVVECCCCIPYQLALMLAPTFAISVLTLAPCALTFAPCTCGVILLSTSVSTPLAHMVAVIGCYFRWWRIFFSHWCKHSLHQWWCHLLQLALVVFFLPNTGTHAPLVLEQLALYSGGLW